MPFVAPTPHSLSPNVGNYRVGRGFLSVEFASDASVVDMGNCTSFEFELKPTLLPHYSSRVGVQKKDLVATTRLDATLTISMEELTAHNMQAALLGDFNKVGGTFTISAMSTPQIYAALTFTDTSSVGPQWSAFFPLVLFTPNKALSMISAGSGAWTEISLQADVLFDDHTGIFANFSSTDIASPQAMVIDILRRKTIRGHEWTVSLKEQDGRYFPEDRPSGHEWMPLTDWLSILEKAIEK